MSILIPAARLALSGLIIYGAYLETGIYTSVCIALIGISVELHTIAITAQLKSIKMLADLNTD